MVVLAGVSLQLANDTFCCAAHLSCTHTPDVSFHEPTSLHSAVMLPA